MVYRSISMAHFDISVAAVAALWIQRPEAAQWAALAVAVARLALLMRPVVARMVLVVAVRQGLRQLMMITAQVAAVTVSSLFGGLLEAT